MILKCSNRSNIVDSWLGMDQFHSDVLKYIFQYLSPGAKGIARFVCSRWRLMLPHRKVSVSRYANNFKLLQWAYSQGAPLDERLALLLAAGGRVNVCGWALDHGLKWGAPFTNMAIVKGNLPVLQEIHRRNLPISDFAVRLAIPHHLEIIKWYGENVISGQLWIISSSSFNMSDRRVIPFLDCMAVHGITYNLESMLCDNIHAENYHVLEWLQKRHPAPWRLWQRDLYLRSARSQAMTQWILSQPVQ